MQNQAVYFCLLLVLIPRRHIAPLVTVKSFNQSDLYLSNLYVFVRLHYSYPIKPFDRTHCLEVYVSCALLESQRQRLTDSDWMSYSGTGSLNWQVIVDYRV